MKGVASNPCTDGSSSPYEFYNDRREFDRYQLPLFLFHNHMKQVFSSPLTAENPSLVNRMFSVTGSLVC
jgi:hypothetical protein